MLRVETYIGPSNINGFGCFAAEPIKKGKIVWKWDYARDVIIFHIPNHKVIKSYIEKYGYKSKGIWYLCSDNARFMNHSPIPNINCLEGYDRALKNIKVGEELTCNYGQFCEDFKGFK